MSAKVAIHVPRQGLHELQAKADAANKELREAIAYAWPVGTKLNVHIRADQINPTLGEVRGHWESCLIVKLTNTKKQRVKYVHWHNIIFP